MYIKIVSAEQYQERDGNKPKCLHKHKTMDKTWIHRLTPENKKTAADIMVSVVRDRHAFIHRLYFVPLLETHIAKKNRLLLEKKQTAIQNQKFHDISFQIEI